MYIILITRQKNHWYIYIYNIIKQHVIQIGMHEAACLIGERGGTVYQRFKSQIRFKPNIYR